MNLFIVWMISFVIGIIYESKFRNFNGIVLTLTSLICGILDIFKIDLKLQLIIFLVLNILGFFIVKTFFKEKLADNSLVGKKAIVIKEINKDNTGEVLYENVKYTAFTNKDMSFNKGEEVLITGNFDKGLMIDKLN